MVLDLAFTVIIYITSYSHFSPQLALWQPRVRSKVGGASLISVQHTSQCESYFFGHQKEEARHLIFLLVHQKEDNTIPFLFVIDLFRVVVLGIGDIHITTSFHFS